MQNRMIETPGTKIKENFGKSKRPTPSEQQTSDRRGRQSSFFAGARTVKTPHLPPDVCGTSGLESLNVGHNQQRWREEEEEEGGGGGGGEGGGGG